MPSLCASSQNYPLWRHSSVPLRGWMQRWDPCQNEGARLWRPAPASLNGRNAKPALSFQMKRHAARGGGIRTDKLPTDTQSVSVREVMNRWIWFTTRGREITSPFSRLSQGQGIRVSGSSDVLNGCDVTEALTLARSPSGLSRGLEACVCVLGYGCAP